MQNYTRKITERWMTKYFNRFGQLHRLDGPAVEQDNGHKEWWINGKRHRLNGPAIEWRDGYKEWYINNKKYTQQEFNNYIKMQEAKELLGIK